MRTTADERLGSAGLAAIDTAAEAAVTGLTTQDAYPVLRAHLALCAVAGRDPAEVLREALASPRGLDDARDVAAVLDWRIDPTGHHSTGAERSPGSRLSPSRCAPTSHGARTSTTAPVRSLTSLRPWLPAPAAGLRPAHRSGLARSLIRSCSRSS
jgi:hypothetical protein